MSENGFHKVNFFSQLCIWHVLKFHLIILGIVYTGKVKGKGEQRDFTEGTSEPF